MNMETKQLVQIATNIIDDFNNKDHNYTTKLADFIKITGKSMYLVLNEACNDDEITFEDALLLERFYALLYDLSDNNFSFYSSRWLLSSWQNALNHAIEEHQIMSSNRVLFYVLSKSITSNKSFGFDCCATVLSEKAMEYDQYLTSRAIDHTIKNVESYIILYHITPSLINFYYNNPDHIFWNQIYAGQILGKVCSLFASYKLNDSAVLHELCTEHFEQINYQRYSDNEFDFEYIYEECSYNKFNNTLFQDISAESQDVLNNI